jgi:hypothetical protein
MKSPAYLARLDQPTSMTRTVMSEIFKDMIRTVCHRVFRLGTMRGTGIVSGNVANGPNSTLLIPTRTLGMISICCQS